MKPQLEKGNLGVRCCPATGLNGSGKCDGNVRFFGSEMR